MTTLVRDGAVLGLVLGLPALLAGGLEVPPAVLALDLPVMLATSLALLPVSFTGFVVARWEGGLFLALYAAYVGYVVLQATSHDALSGFTTVMTLFVLPFVLVMLATTVAYELGRMSQSGKGVLGVSARTGEGMEALRDRLGEVARQMLDVAGPPPLTRARHRFCLQGALEELDEAAAATLPELRAENLRRGMQHLGRITGAVGVEDVLDAVFSRFCIGK